LLEYDNVAQLICTCHPYQLFYTHLHDCEPSKDGKRQEDEKSQRKLHCVIRKGRMDRELIFVSKRCEQIELPWNSKLS
jgi:hypothetical protein